MEDKRNKFKGFKTIAVNFFFYDPNDPELLRGSVRNVVNYGNSKEVDGNNISSSADNKYSDSPPV